MHPRAEAKNQRSRPLALCVISLLWPHWLPPGVLTGVQQTGFSILPSWFLSNYSDRTQGMCTTHKLLDGFLAYPGTWEPSLLRRKTERLAPSLPSWAWEQFCSLTLLSSGRQSHAVPIARRFPVSSEMAAGRCAGHRGSLLICLPCPRPQRKRGPGASCWMTPPCAQLCLVSLNGCEMGRAGLRAAVGGEEKQHGAQQD